MADGARLDAVSRRLRRATCTPSSSASSAIYIQACGGHTDMPCARGARHSTLNINSIHGVRRRCRDILPVVADSCRMVIDRRLLIEESIDAAKGSTRASGAARRDRAGFRYSIEIFRVRRRWRIATPVARSTPRPFAGDRPHARVRLLAGDLRPEAHRRVGKLRDCIATAGDSRSRSSAG